MPRPRLLADARACRRPVFSLPRLLPAPALALALTLACRAAAPPSTADIIYWALGSDTRGDCPARADAYLLLLPSKQPLDRATPATADCMRATSVMSGPPGDSSVYLVIDGTLHVLRRPGQPGAKVEPLLRGKTYPPLPPLTRLLGFRAAASPLQILAAVLPGNATEEELWSFTLGLATIDDARRIEHNQAFASEAAFFTAYQSPRCRSQGRDCLNLSGDQEQRSITIERERGAPATTLHVFENAAVCDIAWAPEQAAAYYLLVACPRPKPAP